MSRRYLGLIALLICLTMIMAGLSTGYAVTTTEYDISELQQPTAALDLVILLDDSGSMYASQKKNDPSSYRYDAASIMLNMCEAEGTQVAIYEFTNDVKPIGSGRLTSIDMTSRERASLTNQLNERVRATAGEAGGGKTHMGTALLKAVGVLDEGAAAREESGRAPVILLLTDGKCDDEDLAALQQGKQACMDRKYKIYTVLLKGSGYEGRDYDSGTLIDLAESTGGRAFELKDATELPEMFAQVFADQTGAELTYNIKQPELVGDNTWKVNFAIPNAAVAECNIMIPTQDLENIQLFRPGDETPIDTGDDSDNVYYFTCGLTPNPRSGKVTENRYAEVKPRFIQYKIMSPKKDRDIGYWTLQFTTENQDAARNVSITVVFDYNLTLKTNYAAQSNEVTVKKGDKIDFSVQFYGPNGQSSKDETLYKGKASPDAETGITCKAYLFFDNTDFKIKDTTPVLELQPGELKFGKSDFNLADFGLDKGTYHSGDYYVMVRAEGDGLIRNSEPVHIIVDNQGPAVKANPERITLTIDDPVRGMEEADSTTVSIDAYLTDPDGDSDVKDVAFTIDDTDLAEIVPDKSDRAHSTLTIRTKGKVGNTDIHVKMTDEEEAEQEIVIPVEVKSVLTDLKGGFEVTLEQTPPAGGGNTYAKGERVTLTVGYQQKDDASPEYQLSGFEPHIELYQIKNGVEEPVLLDGNLQKGDTYDVTLTDEDNGIYTYRVKLYAKDQLIDESEPLILSTENLAPSIIEDSVWEHGAEVGCEKIPDTWLGYKNTEPWEIRFGELIEDKNNDGMTFSYTVEPDRQSFAEITEIKDDNDQLTGLKITPREEGNVIIHVRAQDDYSIENPGILEQDYTVRVTDRHAITVRYGLYILAGIIALLILILIIRAATRPKFRNVILDVTVNNVPQKQYSLTPDIKKRPMSSYVPPNNNFTPGMGAAMLIKPARDGATIVVKKPNLLKGASLFMNGKPMGKGKKALLRRNNGELKADFNGQSMVWKLKSSGGPTPGAGARGSMRNPGPQKPNTPGNPTGRSSTPSYH